MRYLTLVTDVLKFPDAYPEKNETIDPFRLIRKHSFLAADSD